MGHTLIITEKPSAAKAIAEALSDSKPEKKGERNAVWYKFQINGEKHVAAPAVGHLFSLKQVGKGWVYPVFDVEWIPSFKASKRSAFSEIYFRNLEEATKGADKFIIATDYDDEGELIGRNVLKFICGQDDAKRMKFSTMTEEELKESYVKANKHINKKLVEAGITRHTLDWYWGINITRALTLAIKNASQRFKILSSGRVQAPVLHMLSKHEKKIKAFKPKPFWQIGMQVQIGKDKLLAEYEKDKIWDEKVANNVMKTSKGKKADVKKIVKRIMKQKPPVPYNTTAFLSDIYRYFGYTPKQGLDQAEKLYQKGHISYPRTASQQLPADIGYKKILTVLSKQTQYAKDAKFLLGKDNLHPTQGKRKDPAHPAIYPTTKVPKRLTDKQQRVYDLVVRRFMAVFGDPAERESIRIEMDVGGNKFTLNGKRTLVPGWTKLYGKYSKRDEVLLPVINEGDKFDVKKIEKLSKETLPPQRFSQGSVLKEMEKKSLGTKSTRSSILQTLYNRGYLIGKSIEVTELGINVNNILEKNVSELVSEKMSRHLEEETDKILEGKAKSADVLKDAQKALIRISKEFKEKEIKIGKALTKAVIETQEQQSIIGECPDCKGTLKVHKSWRTGKRFVGCSGYKKGCRFGSPLPPRGRIEAIGKVCPECKTPIIQIFMEGKRPFRTCVSMECPTKAEWLDKKRLAKVKKQSIASTKAAKENTCPECGKMFSTPRGLNIHKRVHKKDAKK